VTKTVNSRRSGRRNRVVTSHRGARSGLGSVRIRAIRPTDELELLSFYAGLSSETRRRRFFYLSPGVSPAQAAAFCRTDHEHGEGFVAVRTLRATASPRIVGHLCLHPDGAATAEIAIAVADDFQQQGVGTRLLAVGARWATRKHVEHLTATMLATNGPIHHLLGGLGRTMHAEWDGPGLIKVAIDRD
jgi:acetyltransferase